MTGNTLVAHICRGYLAGTVGTLGCVLIGPEAASGLQGNRQGVKLLQYVVN